jgi:hypothetical protein
MVMPVGDYTDISNGEEEYKFPENPNPLNYIADAATREEQRDTYKRDLEMYNDARALRNQLQAQPLQAIPASYRETLEDPDIGYANIWPGELLEHVFEHFGEITSHDLEINLKTLKTPWDPDTPIAAVFTNGERCRKFAQNNDPITDKTYIRTLIETFRASGVMNEPIRDWENMSATFKTVTNCVKHFTEADKYRRQAKQYVKEALEANNANVVTPSPPIQRRPSISIHGWGYCWSRGICNTHTGLTCMIPEPGHIKEATLDNPQGGNL